MRYFFVLGILILFSTNAFTAEKWLSNDGVFEIQIPDNPSFSRINIDPDVLASWKGPDSSYYYFSIESVPLPQDLPANTRLPLVIFVENAMQLCGNSKLIDSNAGVTSDGFQFFEATVSGTINNVEVVLRQKAFVVNRNIYKIVFSALHGDYLKDHSFVDHMMNSVQIHVMLDKREIKLSTTQKIEKLANGVFHLSIFLGLSAVGVGGVLRMFKQKKDNSQ